MWSHRVKSINYIYLLESMCVSAILRMCKCQRLCKLFLSSSAQTFQDMTFLWKLQSHTHTHTLTPAQNWLHRVAAAVAIAATSAIIRFCLLCINLSLLVGFFYSISTKTQIKYTHPEFLSARTETSEPLVCISQNNKNANAPIDIWNIQKKAMCPFRWW